VRVFVGRGKLDLQKCNGQCTRRVGSKCVVWEGTCLFVLCEEVDGGGDTYISFLKKTALDEGSW